MSSSFWLPVYTLWRRDLIRFWRERTRVLGFLGTPVIFWLIVGSGFGDMAYFFPGTLTLSVMFSALFSMMSLIEDRREGFLLSMMVSPAPRASMVLGKVLGSSTLAWMQALVLLAFLPLAGFSVTPLLLAQLAGTLFLIAFAFTSLGFLFAWKMDSTQGFHAIMNLVLFPLWMVSGSLFTMAQAHGPMQWLMRANPLTYSVAAIRRILNPALTDGSPELRLSILVTLVCGVALWLLSTLVAGSKTTRSQA
ncbi:MAG: ABC transporter permease [Acidobacteriia bacterium]|nr:ABC transporter permease [Terriglobia bacterium]